MAPMNKDQLAGGLQKLATLASQPPLSPVPVTQTIVAERPEQPTPRNDQSQQNVSDSAVAPCSLTMLSLPTKMRQMTMLGTVLSPSRCGLHAAGQRAAAAAELAPGNGETAPGNPSNMCCSFLVTLGFLCASCCGPAAAAAFDCCAVYTSSRAPTAAATSAPAGRQAPLPAASAQDATSVGSGTPARKDHSMMWQPTQGDRPGQYSHAASEQQSQPA